MRFGVLERVLCIEPFIYSLYVAVAKISLPTKAFVSNHDNLLSRLRTVDKHSYLEGDFAAFLAALRFGPEAAVVIYVMPAARLRGLRSATHFARQQTDRRMVGMRQGLFRPGVFSVSSGP